MCILCLKCTVTSIFWTLQSVNITTKVLSSNLAHVEVYSIQHYVRKFVSDFRQVGGFLRVLQFPPPIKLLSLDITEISLKVALNTTTLTLKFYDAKKILYTDINQPIWLQSYLLLAPCYWYAAWEIWGNPTTGQMWVTLCHEYKMIW